MYKKTPTGESQWESHQILVDLDQSNLIYNIKLKLTDRIKMVDDECEK